MKWVEKRDILFVAEFNPYWEKQAQFTLNQITAVALVPNRPFVNIHLGEYHRALIYETDKDAAEAYAEIMAVWNEWREKG
jgi:hypothetical protein